MSCVLAHQGKHTEELGNRLRHRLNTQKKVVRKINFPNRLNVMDTREAEDMTQTPDHATALTNSAMATWTRDQVAEMHRPIKPDELRSGNRAPQPTTPG